MVISVAVAFWAAFLRHHARLVAHYLDCRTNLFRISRALDEYSEKCRCYPQTLNGLTPSCLKVIPTCPNASFQSYQYALAGKSGPYTLSCCGLHQLTQATTVAGEEWTLISSASLDRSLFAHLGPRHAICCSFSPFEVDCAVQQIQAFADGAT